MPPAAYYNMTEIRRGCKAVKKRNWQKRVCEKLYCNPEWNKKLICLKCSFDEVIRILNQGGCHGSRCK